MAFYSFFPQAWELHKDALRTIAMFFMIVGFEIDRYF